MHRTPFPALLATSGLTLGVAVALAAASPGPPVKAAAPAIAVEQQNDFVRTHCAVCHNDRANNGGLSLEGFDGASAAPSLAAMMLSKMTSGTALATVNAAGHDPAAAAALTQGTGRGAINAAGVGAPDKATVDGLVAAFATRSARAREWSVERTTRRAPGAEIVTASIVRELPSAAGAGRAAGTEAAMYRLVLTCNPATREGEMQLAWSPEPKRGTLSVAFDAKPAASFTVAGTERMGNGTSTTSGPAAFVFARTNSEPITLPVRTLTVGELFPGETVTFPFEELASAGRNSLSACFR
jgi:mono/diheme cytochrome c family protein